MPPSETPRFKEHRQPANRPPARCGLRWFTKAAAGSLRKIAPKRFNPKDETWLPVLHTRRGDWHFTVLYSNTQRAHELGKTHDWVVIYFHPGSEPPRETDSVAMGCLPLMVAIYLNLTPGQAPP